MKMISLFIYPDAVPGVYNCLLFSRTQTFLEGNFRSVDAYHSAVKRLIASKIKVFV